MKGAILEESGKYEAAGAEYYKALEILPQSSYLGVITSNAFLRAGKLDEAIQIAGETVRNASMEKEAYRILGRAFTAQKKWNEAIQHYEHLRGLEPDSLDTLLNLANLYLLAKQYDDAIGAFREMCRVNPSHSVIYQLQIAAILYQNRRYEEALKEYTDLSNQAPNVYEVHSRIGAICEILQREDRAIEAYLTALNNVRDPQDELALRKRLGTLYRTRKSYPEACYQYKRIKELFPDDLESRKILASLYIEQKNYQDAYDEVNAIAEKTPDNYRIQRLRFDILKMLDREQEAYKGFLAAFQHALKNRNREEILMYLWDVVQETFLEKSTEYKFRIELVDCLTQAAGIEPVIPRALFAQAQLAFFDGDESSLKSRLESIVSVMKQAEIDRDKEILEDACFESRFWFLLRYEFKNCGLTADVIQTLNEARRAFPQNPHLLYALGLFYITIHNWTDAETVYLECQKAIDEESPLYKDALFQLAYLYEKMDRLADIERLMRVAMERYPDDAEAYNFLGYTYADHNVRLDEALALIEKALKLRPDDGNIIDSLGWAYYRMSRNQEAIEQLRKALELENDHPVILDHLANAYEREGQFDLAVQQWKKALETGPKHPFEFTPEFESKIHEKIHKLETQLQP